MSIFDIFGNYFLKTNKFINIFTFDEDIKKYIH